MYILLTDKLLLAHGCHSYDEALRGSIKNLWDTVAALKLSYLWIHPTFGAAGCVTGNVSGKLGRRAAVGRCGGTAAGFVRGVVKASEGETAPIPSRVRR
jgi:hypothetical protein